ncbi:hypothetical protein PVK06_038965 [Gossypium arboreum]|uniref:Uncharacterized protein n=1 Tax=Gossypium arboreum TaxID=29729 RepID=A0ABR0N1K5_GOSAR|nr:hypothetical protein PVK06_038965 [Gossypium arboreum]
MMPQLGPNRNPFEDESRMGPRTLDTGLEPVQFQAIGNGLSKGKNIAISLKSKKGTLEELISLDNLGCSNSFSNVGMDTGQQPFMMAKRTGENTRQEPNKTVPNDNLTISIKVAIANPVHRLSKYVKDDMVMVGVISYLLRWMMRCCQMLKRHD